MSSTLFWLVWILIKWLVFLKFHETQVSENFQSCYPDVIRLMASLSVCFLASIQGWNPLLILYFWYQLTGNRAKYCVSTAIVSSRGKYFTKQIAMLAELHMKLPLYVKSIQANVIGYNFQLVNNRTEWQQAEVFLIELVGIIRSSNVPPAVHLWWSNYHNRNSNKKILE